VEVEVEEKNCVIEGEDDKIRVKVGVRRLQWQLQPQRNAGARPKGLARILFFAVAGTSIYAVPQYSAEGP
jgi:hypothetical protein